MYALCCIVLLSPLGSRETHNRKQRMDSLGFMQALLTLSNDQFTDLYIVFLCVVIFKAAANIRYRNLRQGPY